MYEEEVRSSPRVKTENPMGGCGKTISHVIIGLKTAKKGTKQLKVSHVPAGTALPGHRCGTRVCAGQQMAPVGRAGTQTGSSELTPPRWPRKLCVLGPELCGASLRAPPGERVSWVPGR